MYEQIKTLKASTRSAKDRRLGMILEEWIVLVKLYFENKEKTRSELAEDFLELSKMLVRRADCLGIEHDEKYRNTNGLAMQFDRIKYMDTNGAKGLSAYSELAEAAIEMYHTNRDGFELLASRCWEKYGPKTN